MPFQQPTSAGNQPQKEFCQVERKPQNQPARNGKRYPQKEARPDFVRHENTQPWLELKEQLANEHPEARSFDHTQEPLLTPQDFLG